jgi:hypothetical protein
MTDSAQLLPNWHLKILEQLDTQLGHSFIADDPDCLLAEENLQRALLDRGFNLYFYEDPIELRYFLEEKVESNRTNCLISVDTDSYDINTLPFDILNWSKRLAVSLGDCFPDLSYSVLNSLEAEDLNALDSALQEYAPGPLNERASSDFVLRHVFKLAPEIIQTHSDLLRALLGLHYRDIDLPNILKARLIEMLMKRKHFSDWPIREIVSSKKNFFGFLQQHWAGYVYEVISSLERGIKEPKVVYLVNLTAVDNIILPFGHDDVRVYVDNLFLEGFLDPIEIAEPDRLSDHWCLIGVRQDPEKELKKRITGLIKLCEENLPGVEDRHQQWLQFAYRWAELSAEYHFNRVSFAAEQYAKLQQKIDQQFSQWLLEKFAGLHNHPPVPPVMLHHAPRTMAREIDSGRTGKVAMILIDGLAIDQWVTLRNQLDLVEEINESAVFAWIPTVTSVSRQSIFSGKAPYQFSNSIHTTSAEPKAWTQFWLDHGLEKNQIFYEKSLGTDDVNALIERLSDRRLKAVGLVINTVDDMMHGMKLGSAGMHNQVKLWAKDGYLQNLIAALLDESFSVFITADHGNVEAIGSGKINEGAIAESRGERTRVYETETLRQSISVEHDETVSWPPVGLPNNYWPLVMKGRKAFVANNEKIVGHGGISIEEVIVPFITISRGINE